MLDALIRDRLREMAGDDVATAFGVRDTEMNEEELRWALRAAVGQARVRMEQHRRDVGLMADIARARG